uniref:Uncharacterized protein n=1 Tax=Ananas comosus var. bracteatus TaxID=296719 RepID=A0A6V7QPA6_ANACO|nr:unnamed protein product [Ananas comosus var. bracteatus]
MGRAPRGDEQGVKKGPWTAEEDKKLVEYIEKHGHGNWRSLPTSAGLNRCGKSCRLRWTNYLRPDIKRGKFSEDEERLIIHLHSILGNKLQILQNLTINSTAAATTPTLGAREWALGLHEDQIVSNLGFSCSNISNILSSLEYCGVTHIAEQEKMPNMINTSCMDSGTVNGNINGGNSNMPVFTSSCSIPTMHSTPPFVSASPDQDSATKFQVQEPMIDSNASTPCEAWEVPNVLAELDIDLGWKHVLE